MHERFHSQAMLPANVSCRYFRAGGFIANFLEGWK
jgi:hypothetical protein